MELLHASGIDLVEIVCESQSPMGISVCHSGIKDPLHGVLATVGLEVVDIEPIDGAGPVASVPIHVVKLVPDLVH